MSDETVGGAQPQGPPTEEDLRELPALATLAFAARCALRAEPWFALNWHAAPTEHTQAIDQAIRLAQASAASSARARYAEPTVDAVYAAYLAADHEGVSNAADAAYAAYAAVRAIGAARDATRAAYAASAVVNAPPSCRDAVVRAIWRDLGLLVEAADRFNWTDDTPVCPEFFGPLWPEGEPEGWPEKAKEERTPVESFTLSVTGPEGTSTAEVVEKTKEIVRLMEAVNRASGGLGLHLEDDTNVYDTMRSGSPAPMVGGGV